MKIAQTVGEILEHNPSTARTRPANGLHESPGEFGSPLPWRDDHFQSRRPVLVFVGVVEVRAAGRAGVGAWNSGDQAQREIELVFGLKVAPVEDDFPADDF